MSRCQVLPLRSVPVAEIEGLLRQRGGDPDQVRLIASLAGGRVGWALQALEQPTFLQQLQDDVRCMLQLLKQNRAQRIQQAEVLATKADLERLLRVWQLCWRDLFLMQSGCAELVTITSVEAALSRVAGQFSREACAAAWRDTVKILDQLMKNVNARLALEVLLLSWPRVETSASDPL